MLFEMESDDGDLTEWTWEWWVLDGVTTSTTEVCNVSPDIEVSADTTPGSDLAFPDTNIGPFTSHGISGCQYYGTTDGATVGTMTCPGVESITCEEDPQFNQMFSCGGGVYLTADVLCVF